MNIQNLIVALIIIAAIAYVAYSMYKSAKGKSCESGCCGTDSKPIAKHKG